MLCKSEIKAIIEKGAVVPKPNDDTWNNPAKIDLRLGELCYVSSDPDNIIELAKDSDSIILPPNEVLLFQSLEKFNLPGNIVAHMGLRMKYISKGLLMPNATHIDPGYKNYIFGLIYNLSNQNVHIFYKEAIATIEFEEIKFSGLECSLYEGSMQETNFKTFVQNRVKSSLGMLQKRTRKAVRNSERSLRIGGIVLASISAVITAVTLVIAIPSILGITNYQDIEYECQENVQKIEELTARIDSLEKQVKYYENNTIETQIDPNASDSVDQGLTPGGSVDGQ